MEESVNLKEVFGIDMSDEQLRKKVEKLAKKYEDDMYKFLKDVDKIKVDEPVRKYIIFTLGRSFGTLEGEEQAHQKMMEGIVGKIAEA